MSHYPSGLHSQQDAAPAQQEATRSMNSMARHIINIHQQQQHPVGFPQFQTFNNPQQGYIVDLVVQNVLSALRPILTDNHERSMEKTKELETLIEAGHEKAKEHMTQVVDQLEASHKKQTRSLLKHIDKLEKAIGTLPKDKSHIDAISSVQFNLGELLERADKIQAHCELLLSPCAHVLIFKYP
jgi:hypothetical protein